ncbi:MAG: histidinol-phosphate transaminase [Gammaproteobacteria bacterium]|nr:MAG: histidinol-phosphate transaminase [Gammaproteobacteria bacterium]
MSNKYLELTVPGVRGLHPYQPGKPISELEREYGVSDIVKLASNENPTGPGPLVRQAIERTLDDLARYPDANGFALKGALARRHGVPAECITLGNGSNDVLVLLAEAFLQPGLEAVHSQFAFAVYPLAIQAAGAAARVAPALSWEEPQPLGHDLTAMGGMVGEKTRLVFIANPNNPTGTWIDGESLENFVSSMPDDTLVVIDEAYSEYVEDPTYPDCVSWVERYPNLIVTRTFSKAFGLAGLRIGYAVSHPGIADILNRLRQPFNVNTVAQEAAVAALADEHYLTSSVRMNNSERVRLTDAFTALELRQVPSVCNFVLVDFDRPAGSVYEALLRKSVIVRPVANYGLPDCLRISIGTPDENERLISALTEVLTESGG